VDNFITREKGAFKGKRNKKNLISTGYPLEIHKFSTKCGKCG